MLNNLWSKLMGSLMAWLALAATLFAGLWGRKVYQTLKADRDRIQATRDAIDQAGQRLDAARKAPVTPIDVKKRRDFEQQP